MRDEVLAFLGDLNDLILFDQKSNKKYVKIHSVSDCDGFVVVYIQRRSNNLIKVSGSLKKKGALGVFSEDVDLGNDIANLPSFVALQTHIIETAENLRSVEIIDKLSFGL